MMRRYAPWIAIAVGIAGCILAWRLDATALLAAYLAAWWCAVGVLLGGLANVWLHNLTGGAWGEAIRAPLLRNAQWLWLTALLFLPIALGTAHLYPWAAHSGSSAWSWHAALSAPGFKDVWLSRPFFIGRSVFYLIAWHTLARLSMRPGLRRARLFSAFALITYGFTVSLASVDWIMSLMPLWYSSVFGLLAGTAQMLAGMALAIVMAIRRGTPPAVLRDLGNLLLMYVMTLAYLSFVQFLIIWAENLPHEISWYLVRARQEWVGMAQLLVLLMYFVPQLLLLSRRFKETPHLLGALAAGIVLMSLVYAWWLVLPSAPEPRHGWLWFAPSPILALAGLAWLLAPRHKLKADERSSTPRMQEESRV
ncbi:MAG TPA: hypothetical protein VL528_01270 [Oxalicibacterium sp.]|jgi:hypothetical protein|nr:hypothetical protein [Oxalicibacterium sp.]